MLLDTELWITAISERLEDTQDDVCRRNLEVVRAHMIAERDGDLSGLMATLGPNPVYAQWGGPARVSPVGTEAVLGFYSTGISEGRGAYLEYKMDRIVVDRNAVVTDGVRRSVFPGRLISGPDGWPVSNYPVEGDDVLYLVEERQITTWPFEGELLGGEEFYRVVTDVRKLDADELREYAAAVGAA